MHPRAESFVAAARDSHGFDPHVEEFDAGTRTAADAADAIGCRVAQIASSLVFDADGNLVVVVTSGANRVDEDRLAAVLEADSVEMADADRVKTALGWTIGGVPPICHGSDVPIYVDETLLEFETVWAAAGTPEAVFPVTPAELLELTDGNPVVVAGRD
ncbi:YbaK/EbsC family protein [Salinirubellus salinus]|uniref:YbaK/EbsC family protein n=1 Tax=Salinirubellus salinus TaxID=1364945 RepID=A0A9E7R4M3_9EURY|nr:YbaK/EbsC family protein [Salinirubellus salinus]UWM55709.1 YbaK/EbsC family protein [Salinirubellus salinus]